MIANKANGLSMETALDAGLWPPEQSFFGNDCPPSQSYITPQSPHLVTSDDEWLQDFEVFRGLCDGLELGLNYEPEMSLEAMTKEVDTQYPSKTDDLVDYLDSTAFLSPQSLEALSPKSSDGSDGNHFESELDFAAQELNTTSAMTILEEILSSSSANSTDTEDCLDAELGIQSVTEVSKEWPSIDMSFVETHATPKRRQTKRKAKEMDVCLPKSKPKANKRSKTTVTEKRERKRDQNKSAANRYRIKKRAELESIDDLQNQYSKANDELRAQLQKLQMEFKVVFPLAKAAFAADANKALQLQMLDIRVLNDNLLD
jgi:cyclic AMP-dependent transcription factor ATF-4